MALADLSPNSTASCSAFQRHSRARVKDIRRSDHGQTLAQVFYKRFTKEGSP